MSERLNGHKPVPITNEHQVIKSQWEKHALGERTMFSRLNKLQEETSEVFDPLKSPIPRLALGDIENMSPQNSRYLAEECTDIILVALNIIQASGHDFENLFKQKMDKIYQKYPRSQIDAALAQGMGIDDAVEAVKGQWTEQGKQ